MTTTCPRTLPKPVLPSIPTVILRLVEATGDEKKSVKELADLAGKDPALSTHILKIANSALVNPGQPIKTISQAALILGLSTLRHVAITAAVCQTLSRIKVPDNFSLSNYWNHSLTCALVCKNLVTLVDQSLSGEEAFLAGLLHDIGQLSLVMKMPEAFDQIVQNPRTGQTVLDSESRIWGVDHTKEGFELLGRWRLPLSIRSAARFHHEDKEQIAEAVSFLKIVYAGDLCAHYIHGESSFSIDDMVDIFRELGIEAPASKLVEVFDVVVTSLRNTAEELGIEIDERDGTRLTEDEGSLRLLENRSRDLATLIGVLESLLSVRSRKELHSAIFAAIATLTEIDTAVLFRFSGNCLKGVCAKGTEDDTVITHISIMNIKESIWDQALQQASPVYSKEFFQGRQRRTIDLQISDYIGGEFVVIGLKAGREKVGALALKASQEQWNQIKKGADVLALLGREIAQVLQGLSYRHLWEKEHVLNELLIKKLPVGITVAGANGQIFFMNEAAQRLLGVTRTLSKEGDIGEILDLSMDKVSERLSSGRNEARLGRKKIVSPDGTTRWIDIRIASLPMGGNPKFIFFITDITDSVTLEQERKQRSLWLEKELIKKTQELRKAQEKLIQSERMGAASEMARKVVHEVNNPLGIIKNLLKILKIQKESGTIEDKTIDAIGSEIDRVGRLVRKLSDFSKAGMKTSHSGEPAAASLEKVLSDLETLLKPGLSEKGITLSVDIEDGLPKAAVSEDELKQILINLFKNAEEALERDGRIVVKARQENGQIVVEFGDTGPGVPKGVRERIFSPFVTTKGEENSGLGLSVCYGLLKACGGDIVLADRDGFGAFFLIRIPVAGLKK